MYEQFLDREMFTPVRFIPMGSQFAGSQLFADDYLRTTRFAARSNLAWRLVLAGAHWLFYAAKHYGVHVTTTTISDAQMRLCQSALNVKD